MMFIGRNSHISDYAQVLKYFVFLAGISLPLSSPGQKKSLSDTVKIGEIIVNGRSFFSTSGNNMIKIDSNTLKDYMHDNISEVISDNTPVYVKSYGSGGIATISLRGTGAGYTQLTWNGANINSPMLGQTDLSLIPAGFIDDINIYYGGSSLPINNGGIGGIINLETKPVWVNGTKLSADLSAGSFGRYSGLFKAKTGNKNFQSSTRALFQSAENNFLYLNTFTSGNPEKEHRKNASVNQSSLLQELFYHKENSAITGRIWYQNTFRKIPVPIVNQQPDNGETQNDESLRTMINYSGYSGKSDYNASLSWFAEKLIYKNPMLSLNSQNISNTLLLKGGFEGEIDEKTKMSFQLNDELSIVNSVNYSDTKSRNLAAVTISLNKKAGKRIDLSALIKQTIKDNSLLIPDFFTGLNYRLSAGKEYFIKINVSHNTKVPTLNDMYWNPGGNQGLKNEYSYSGELIYEMSSKISSYLSASSQISLYMISIDNMIKWTPGEYGYWTPSNIEKARSAGAEANISLLYEINSLRIRFNTNYGWNRAYITGSFDGESITGKQLIYAPENQFNAGIRTSYKNFYFSWQSIFTGKRYTSADNSEYLPGYFINNASSGIIFYSGKNTFNINLKVENLFNVDYQAIAWYPMPGRSYILSIIYKLKI